MITPTGRSVSPKAREPNRSELTSSIAPIAADAATLGPRRGPTRRPASWGAASATNEIGPAASTATADNPTATATVNPVVAATRTPRAAATSGPSSISRNGRASASAAPSRTASPAAAANPGFAGKKAIFLQNAVYDGNLIAYQKGLSTEFLTDLGFAIPAEIDPFVKEGEQAYIPVEKISVLNAADVLVWGTEKDSDRVALEKVPGFASLTAVQAGRSVYTSGELAGAIYFASPLSLPFVVDQLVPMLAGALKG